MSSESPAGVFKDATLRLGEETPAEDSNSSHLLGEIIRKSNFRHVLQAGFSECKIAQDRAEDRCNKL